MSYLIKILISLKEPISHKTSTKNLINKYFQLPVKETLQHAKKKKKKKTKISFMEMVSLHEWKSMKYLPCGGVGSCWV